jgi:hypothetical protein
MDRGELEKEIGRLRDATSALAPDDGLTDAVMAQVAGARTEGDPLAKGAQAEEGPDAVIALGAEDPLAEIARRTRAIEPQDGLTDAVMERAASEVAPFLAEGGRRGEARAASGRAASSDRSRAAGTWLDGVVRAGPVAVGLAAALAAACFALFLSSQSSLDATVATAFDAVEVTE